MSDLTQRTIDDFGDQWTSFTDNTGYYASAALFADILGPVLQPSELAGTCVADIGSGTGRIVGMLLDAGVAHVVAVEPSQAIEVLRRNTQGASDRITYVHAPGEELPSGLGLDFVFCIGVLHHVPDPMPIVRAAFHSLSPGGEFVVWLYGQEGNEAYLRAVTPLRALGTRVPHRVLVGVSHCLTLPLTIYARLCTVLPLPMHRYMTEHIVRLPWKARALTVYDQLNPAYAKYYRKDEAVQLLASGGFSDVRVHHRHGYSWTVAGTRPCDVAPPTHQQRA